MRAVIRSDNVASLATMANLGFREVGQHLDEEDGLLPVFEVAADRFAPA